MKLALRDIELVKCFELFYLGKITVVASTFIIILADKVGRPF
jgi:hypothetical protein